MRLIIRGCAAQLHCCVNLSDAESVKVVFVLDECLAVLKRFHFTSLFEIMNDVLHLRLELHGP